MTVVIIIVAAALWLGTGLYTAILDKKAFPRPVIWGVDEAFRVWMVLAGPAALAAALFMGLPEKARRERAKSERTGA